MAANQRRAQVIGLLRAAGPVGLQYQQLARMAGADPDGMRNYCCNLRTKGLLARVGGRFLLAELLPAGVPQDPPGLRNKDAKPYHNPCDKRQRGLVVRDMDRASFIRTKEQQVHNGVITPAGVPVTSQVAPRGRFDPAPGFVGEFTRQWQEARR